MMTASKLQSIASWGMWAVSWGRGHRNAMTRTKFKDLL